MEPLRENKLFDIRLFGAARSRAGSQNLKFQITSLLSSRFGIFTRSQGRWYAIFEPSPGGPHIIFGSVVSSQPARPAALGCVGLIKKPGWLFGLL
jgi:hypothetical protein